MHIPDGFLSPLTWVPAAVVAGGAWYWAGRDLRSRLDETVLPRQAVLTALAYGLGLVMVPLPGATSGHLVGVSMLTLLFGVRQAFLAYSLVLLLQSLLFGAGGITAFPVNALAIGLAGACTTQLVYRALRRINEALAIGLAAWMATLVAALLVGLVLGAQPWLASDARGQPLFFPFGWSIVVPAVLLPHLLIGLGEAAVTLAVWRFALTRGWWPRPVDPAAAVPSVSAQPSEPPVLSVPSVSSVPSVPLPTNRARP